jgi:hypothetical protein
VGWSNGPTEGHINRLKTLKQAMRGRAGVDQAARDAAAAWLPPGRAYLDGIADAARRSELAEHATPCSRNARANLDWSKTARATRRRFLRQCPHLTQARAARPRDPRSPRRSGGG